MSALIAFFQRIFDLKGWVPGSLFVQLENNEIGGSFSFWELNGDELHRLNEVKVRNGALKVR